MRLESIGGSVAQWTAAETSGFTFCEGGVTRAGTHRFVYDAMTTELSLIYSFQAANVQRDGIAVHWTSAQNTLTETGGYHFRPPFGWMNDPNGVCKVGDLYHLFYQHYPHRRRWNNMHWGHAVSKDMVTWVHQPIFLHPPGVLANREDAVGGAYSGSALPVDGTLQIFFTDHFNRRQPEVERQMHTSTRDAIFAEPGTVIIDRRPDSVGPRVDFRDPFVIEGPDTRLKMLLGSQANGVGVVLLYETSDRSGKTGWSFVGQIHAFDRFPFSTSECPCLIRTRAGGGVTDDEWALVVSLKQSRDPATKRKNLTIAALGTFDGRRFVCRSEQEFDFGTDCYAFQTFLDRDGPRGIGWMANWTDIDRKVDCETAMTLPRRLLASEDGLRSLPIDGVEGLRRELLAEDTGACAVDIPTGQAEISFDFAGPGTVFRVEFEHPSLEISVACDGNDFELIVRAFGLGDTPRYVAKGARPSDIRIFLDVGSIEVFADGGRWVASKRLPGHEPVRRLRFGQGSALPRQIRVWRLEGATRAGQGHPPLAHT
jgi:beta-fructofuranosidase